MKKESSKQRLSKILAAAGVASRRACEELIFTGRVQVNHQITLIPQTMVDPKKDHITVDGKKIEAAENRVYFILNKPIGYICSNLRRGQTKLVIDLFPEIEERLFTVGRLDKDTEGLILVTNDGHFANNVMHPSFNIPKEYLVKTNEEITHDHLMAIAAGTLVDGVFVKPKYVKKIRRGTLKICVMEGKKHEVRLLLNAAGLQVKGLARIRIGNLQLGTLPVGTYRPMTEQEKKLVLGP
jgi:23S rRNA pseudouridine2605 synthase